MPTRTELEQRSGKRLKVAWIVDFPIEWLPDLPESLRQLRRKHPATWAMVLLGEFRHRKSLDIHIFVIRSKVASNVTFERDGITFHILKAPGIARAASVFWYDTLILRRFLVRIQPDLIHAWGTELAAPLIASRLPWPHLTTMQGILTWYAEKLPASTALDRLMTWLEPISLRRARVATVESSFSVSYLGKRYPKLRILQAEHAPNRLFHQAVRNCTGGKIRLLSVGSMGYRKGTDLLVRALDQLNSDFDFEVTLIGSTSVKFLDSLKTQTSEEIWSRLLIRHGLAPSEIASELAQATMVVFPTRVDNSPNAVKEAAVVGVPVIASEVGGIPDYITHGKNGLLFRAGDQEALASTLRDALRHPQFSKGQVDGATWNNVRDYLSPQRMGENFFEAYQQVLEAWGRHRFESE